MSGLEEDMVLIRALVDYAGVSSAQVAQKAKVNPRTIQRMKNGNAEARLSQVTLEKLHEAFPKFPGWTRAGAAALASFDEPDLVPVREIDLSYGMGATYLDVPVTEEVHHFPRAWLRRYTRSAPDKLFFAQGIGDSMEPTLHDSDLLLIDTAQRQLTSADRIWVLTYAECGMIKRLRPVPGGGVEVWSDKKEVSPFTAYDGEIEIIGRVVAVQRKL
ncbi:hypothetical protein GCM10009076_12450 [Erythrobacter ramosus]